MFFYVLKINDTHAQNIKLIITLLVDIYLQYKDFGTYTSYI